MNHKGQPGDPADGGEEIFRIASETGFGVFSHVVMVLLLIAAAIAVVAYLSPLPLDINSPDFNPVVVLVVFLGILAAREGVQAARSWSRRKVGESVLELRDRPYVVLGQELRGTIRLPAGLRPSGAAALLLECREVGGSTPRILRGPSAVARHTAVRWKSRQSVEAFQVLTGIPVRFQLPPTDPVSDTSIRRGVVRWELEVRMPCQEQDYKARFVVPVFNRDPEEDDTEEGELDETSRE